MESANVFALEAGVISFTSTEVIRPLLTEVLSRVLESNKETF